MRRDRTGRSAHNHDHDHHTLARGFLASIVGRSHDPSDSVDYALTSSTRGIRAVKIALVGLGVTAIAQLAVALISGSVALLAATIHNFSDAQLELLPGLRLVPAPGHTPGSQVVVVDTGGRRVVGGDMAVWHGELDDPTTESQLLVGALNPEMVWLAHEHEPWRPPTV